MISREIYKDIIKDKKMKITFWIILMIFGIALALLLSILPALRLEYLPDIACCKNK
jgi:hypothetical protein